jgi:hypothetical protein
MAVNVDDDHLLRTRQAVVGAAPKRRFVVI